MTGMGINNLRDVSIRVGSYPDVQHFLHDCLKTS